MSWLDDYFRVPGPTGSTGPTGATGSFVGYRQSVFADQTTDTSTTSTSFGTLLSATLTPVSSYLLITTTFSASCAALLGQGIFRLNVNGTPLRGAEINPTVLGIAQSGALVSRVLAVVTPFPGTVNTVLLEWRTTAGTTLQIRPVTAPDTESASLLVEEVSS